MNYQDSCLFCGAREHQCHKCGHYYRPVCEPPMDDRRATPCADICYGCANPTAPARDWIFAQEVTK